MASIDVPQGIGPALGHELYTAGLSDGVGWARFGTAIRVRQDKNTAYLRAVDAVAKAHDPRTPAPPDEQEVMAARLKAAVAKSNLEVTEARAIMADAEMLLKGA